MSEPVPAPPPGRVNDPSAPNDQGPATDQVLELVQYLWETWEVDDGWRLVEIYGFPVVRKVVDLWKPWTDKYRPRDHFHRPSGAMVRKIQDMARSVARGVEPPARRESTDTPYIDDYRRRHGRLPWEKETP